MDTWVSTDCVTAIDPESSVLMGQDGAMGRLSHSFVVQKGTMTQTGLVLTQGTSGLFVLGPI